MLDKVKNYIHEKKNKIIVGAGVSTTALMTTATTALASSTNDTAQNLTTGMSGFISLVTTMVETILGSATLSIAFAASFAFLAVRLIRKLKKT